MDGTENLTKTFLEMYHLLHEYHMAWYQKNFGGIDPRHGQGRILSALSRMNAVSQKELGFILDMRPQSLGELLQKLEANGYIERRKSLADKRALLIELTEKGEYFQKSRPDYEELFSDMSEDERENLNCSLQKISDKLEELIYEEEVEEEAEEKAEEEVEEEAEEEVEEEAEEKAEEEVEEEAEEEVEEEAEEKAEEEVEEKTEEEVEEKAEEKTEEVTD